jgi:hypothetical protein
MTLQTAIAQLRAARNGHEMLQVLNAIAGGYEYVESPMIEQVLGVATLEPIEF